MSFVQKLRMNNIFPITDFDMGYTDKLPQYGGADPMMEIMNNFRRTQPEQGDNLSKVAQRNISPPTPTEGLKFGGVIGQQGNPGADILARSKASAEKTYANYPTLFSQPTPKGPSNDEQNLNDYFERQNRAKTADAALIKAEQDGSGKGWSFQQVVDPNDPYGNPRTVRAHAGSGTIEEVKLPDGGVMSTKLNPKQMQEQNEKEKQGEDSRQDAIRKTTKSLETMRDLMADDGSLTDEARFAVGKSSLFNWVPTGPGRAGANKIDQLKKQQVLALITDLKEKSRTGSIGMGNMSNKDLSVIEHAASLLDVAGTEEEFQKQLGIVKTELQDILQRLQSEPVRATRDPNTGNVPITTNPQLYPPNLPPPAQGMKWQRRNDNKGWTQVPQ